MCKLHARASSPSSPVPPCPWGAHSPSSPTLGQPVLGLLGKCSLGGHEQDPSSSPSGVVTASPALGQDADPCHPTQPHQGHATSPPAQESDTAVTVAAGETAAATELPHVRPGPWLVALRVDQGGLDAGPVQRRRHRDNGRHPPPPGVRGRLGRTVLFRGQRRHRGIHQHSHCSAER